jgi:hypothetical protein
MSPSRHPAFRLWIATISALTAGCATESTLPPEARHDFAQTVISRWSDPALLLAAKLIEEYGPPDRIDYSRIAWNEKGPWKRITVWDIRQNQAADMGTDDIEQTAACPVPAEKIQALAAFSGKIRVSQDGGELSARSDSEEQNFLAINLAHEIILGHTDQLEARRLYDRIIKLSSAGKYSPYMRKLLFQVQVRPPVPAP